MANNIPINNHIFADNRLITLISDDDVIFRVMRDTISHSTLLENLCRKLELDGLAPSEEPRLPLLRISGSCLKQVIKYLTKLRLHKKERASLLRRAKVNKEFALWEEEFLGSGHISLYDLTLAANYMVVPKLAELCRNQFLKIEKDRKERIALLLFSSPSIDKLKLATLMLLTVVWFISIAFSLMCAYMLYIMRPTEETSDLLIPTTEFTESLCILYSYIRLGLLLDYHIPVGCPHCRIYWLEYWSGQGCQSLLRNCVFHHRGVQNDLLHLNRHTFQLCRQQCHGDTQRMHFFWDRHVSGLPYRPVAHLELGSLVEGPEGVDCRSVSRIRTTDNFDGRNSSKTCSSLEWRPQVKRRIA